MALPPVGVYSCEPMAPRVLRGIVASGARGYRLHVGLPTSRLAAFSGDPEEIA